MAAYTRDVNGPPVQGRYDVGDTVTDAAGTVWQCAVGGMAASFPAAGTAKFIAAPTGLSPTELAFLDGVTAGTLAASKAVVADANSHMNAFHATTLGAGKSGTAGTAEVYPATGSKGKLAITKADNTNNDTTTLAVDLHGQATSVHIPDGGAAASYVVQSTAALTLAEADVLDGAVVGTLTASKAVVADANSHVNAFHATTLGAGKSGTAGTAEVYPATGSKGKLAITKADNTNNDTTTLAVDLHGQATSVHLPDGGAAATYLVQSTAAVTMAEADVLDGATVGVPVASKALIAPASLGNGAVAGTGVTVSEQGDGVVHKSVITFTNVDVALADNAGVTAYGSLKVYDLPEGAILFLGAVSDIDLTKSSAGVNADWDGDVGIGTEAANNGATPLATTEQNLIPNTATPQAVAGVTTANAESTTSENVVISGTGGALDVYVNLLVDDADHDVTGTACNLILNGTLTLHWINLGDF